LENDNLSPRLECYSRSRVEAEHAERRGPEGYNLNCFFMYLMKIFEDGEIVGMRRRPMGIGLMDGWKICWRGGKEGKLWLVVIMLLKVKVIS
jgi:hypothetical protein